MITLQTYNNTANNYGNATNTYENTENYYDKIANTYFPQHYDYNRRACMRLAKDTIPR